MDKYLFLKNDPALSVSDIHMQQVIISGNNSLFYLFIYIFIGHKTFC